MHALGGAAATPPGLLLEPAVAGSWQWRGARGVSFVPTALRLPAATAFKVSVLAGTRALDGTELTSAFEFQFETPAPEVVSSTPEPGAAAQQPDVRLALRFNQPMLPAAVEQAAQLRAWRGQVPEAIAFNARPHAGAPEQVDIVPRRALPLGSRIELTLGPGLRGSEGPRPMAAAHALSFETYGPLGVVGFNCDVIPQGGGCDPEGSLWVELVNPVKRSAFKQHFQSEPPLPLAWPEELEDESRYIYLPLASPLAPATRYRLSVNAGLVDAYGQRLAKPSERELSTGNFAARAQLPIQGEVFVAPLSELSLVSRNALGLRVFSQRLDADKLLDYFQAQNDYERRQRWAERLGASGVAVSSALDNQVHSHPIALGALLGGGAGRGAAWLGWSSSGSGVEGQLVQVTDLALTAKLSEQGSLVWVTRLGDGRPVAGASVELIGRAPKIQKRYVTDAEGLVSIPKEDFRPRLQDYGSEDDTLLFARHEGDSSFRRIADFLPPWRIEPAMRLSVAEREYSLLFSERGIYRPGDSVRVKGILRREAKTGNTLIASRKLGLELADPFGEVLAKQSVETTRFGTFSADVQVPGSAALGGWRIALEGFPDDALVIEVAEYRPAEFKVGVEPAAPSYVRDEAARFRVRADYLFGSPMSGAHLGYGVTRQRTSFTPAAAAGYVTSEDAYRQDLELEALDASVLGRAEVELSAQGEHEVSVPLALPGQTGPEQVRLDADVSDVSRQVISSSAAVIVHPASYYLGIAELDSWFQSTPSVLEPRLVALSPSGQIKSQRAVKLELVRRRWTLAREKTADGWRSVSAPVDEVQAACELVTAAKPVSCKLGLKESGQFFVRASSKDERGRVARAALGFYAIGAGRAGWADNDRRKLELVLDKPRYKVGDTARLLIKSPFERAEALLTVERAGLYEHRRLTLEGPTPTVEIAIDERLRPNAFVSVHLVQGVVANPLPAAPEVTPEPGYRMGYAELLVDPEARRLAVELKGQAAEYRPGQRARFELRVTRAGGVPHPAELTVYAVDEGVLSLIGYEPPDPVRVFTAPRPLAVATLESRDALGRLLLPALGSDKGMDGGGGGAAGARSNFKTTAFFDPNVLTDAEGKAVVEFDLPDSLTTFRVMAVAVSDDDRYGVGSTLLTVNEPLMIRPALPRALRVGDRFEASAIVTSRNLEAGMVKVSASVTGATLEGPAERQVQLDKGASAEVRFSVLALEPGEARFEFAAVAGAEADRVVVSRKVASPTALEATALYGRTEQAEAQALGDLTPLRKDVGGLKIALASTALVGLDAGVTQLLHYPYACTEQLASRLLPLAPLRGLAERYGIALDQDIGAALEAQVGEILRRQRGDGGFGLWPSSVESQPWVSAYALWVLDQAKLAGARIPARIFQQGVSYLRASLGQPRTTPEAWATAAFMVDVLSALGQPDLEYISQLFERRAELPAFARALLLHASSTGKADASVVATLTAELEALIGVHGNKAQVTEAQREPFPELFDSEARTEALVLWALIAVKPDHPLAAALARGVLERRASGHWRSTQESAYALLALDAYRRAQEPASPQFDAVVWFGERRLFQAAFNAASPQSQAHELGMSELRQLSGPLRFEKQGAGSLFYEARLTYAPERLPEQALERGFSLQKSMRSVSMATLSEELARAPLGSENAASLAAGDLVLVDLVLAAPERRHFVVLEDPLPAGLEAVDANLATTSRALDVEASPNPSEAPESGFQSAWYRRELRDDRVLFFVDQMPAGLYHYRYLARATALGRFVTPPTRAEEMYQPEVFGRTGASLVEVH